MIDKEHLALSWHVLGAHQVCALCVLILDDLGNVSNVKVLKGNLLPKLTVKALWQLDCVKLGFVEDEPCGVVLVGLCGHYFLSGTRQISQSVFYF